jgi:hypothetical protein
MPTANEYRQYAEFCERIAGESSEKQEKAILRQIATQWRRLANIKDKQTARQSEAQAHQIAANIAKLPELLREP